MDSSKHEDSVACETLEARLHDPDVMVRVRAIEAIAAQENPAKGGYLVDLLQDTEPLVRWRAAEGIGILGYQPARAPLVRLVRADRTWMVRLCAAEALGELGVAAPEVLEVLIVAMQSEPKPLVRTYAAASLGKLGDVGTAEAIRLRVGREPNVVTRAVMLAALSRLGDREALRSLLRMLARVRNADTLFALQNMLDDLITREDKATLQAALTAAQNRNPSYELDLPPTVARAQSKSSPESLIEDLDYSLAAVRRGAIYALAKQRHQPAIAPFLRVLGTDEDPAVREAVAEALGDLKLPNPEILAALELAAQTDVDERVRMYAAESLGRLKIAESGHACW